MASVTGYTSAKMEELANQQIIGGHVTGSNLILERRDGGMIVAGAVRGPEGPPSELLFGTWDEMQLTSPLIANIYFRCTDQAITYKSDGAIWVRTVGDPSDLWWTDFGAVPNADVDQGHTTHSSRNKAAWDSLVSAQRTPALRRSRVVVPVTSAGGEFTTDGTLDADGMNVISSGGGLSGFSLQSDSYKPVINGGEITGNLPTMEIFGGAAISALTKLKEILVIGNNIGLKIKRAAHVVLDDVDLFCNSVDDADNAALYIENSFWIDYIRGGLRNGSGVSPSRAHPCVRIVSEDIADRPIYGIGQGVFEHLRPNYGGICFENRSDGALVSNTQSATFTDIVSESQSDVPLFYFINNGGAHAAQATLLLTRCERADAGTTTAMIEVGSTWTLVDSIIRNCAGYSTYLISCAGGGEVYNLSTDTTGNSGFVFDPANEPSNGLNNRLEVVGFGFTSDAESTSLHKVTGGQGFSGGQTNHGQAYYWWNIGNKGTWRLGNGIGEFDTLFKPRSSAGKMLFQAQGTNPVEFGLDNSDITKDVSFQFKVNHVDKWRMYIPGSEDNLHFSHPSGPASGDVLTLESTGRLILAVAYAGSASLNIPQAATPPSAPRNGDIWNTASAQFHRLGGVTKEVAYV